MVDGLGCGYYSVGTVILTNYWLGQRLNDILALPIRPIQDGRTVIAQHKTNARVSLPSGMVEELVVRLDQQARQSAAVQAGAVVQPMALIISEATRRPYTEAGDTTHHFGRRFRAVRAEASRTMPDCAGLHPQMLRHTAVVALADAGCTVPEIAAISGHSLASVHGILQRYLRATAVQAANAMRKRLAASENAVAVRQEKAQ